jgi:uncharacterized protein with NAD-binding domain and iron-sulfur cluster
MSEGAPAGGSGGKNVIILGGGVGAMTAAFELSQGDWRQRFDRITVYQLGWRLGGKGASGRGDNGRIEEHGLHMWFGFYENAFRMMRQCYKEVADISLPPDRRSITSLDDGFVEASTIVAEEDLPDGWRPWVVRFPSNPGEPGLLESTDELPTPWDYVRRALALAAELLRSTGPGRTGPPGAAPPGVYLRPVGRPPAAPPVVIRPPTAPLSSRVAGALLSTLKTFEVDAAQVADVAMAEALAVVDDLDDDPRRHSPQDHGRLSDFITKAAEWASARIKAEVEESEAARRDWYVADILLACARGMLADGLLTHPDGFGAIDEYDFSEWLVRHGADEESATSAPVRAAAYDLVFGYRDGDYRQPAVSAAVALRGLGRMLFTSNGPFAWKMQAGMGDVVFAPLYLALKQRGVDFRFFHRVTALRPADDGYTIGAIELEHQAVPVDPRGYDPLVTVEGLQCWPAEPRWDLIEHVESRDPFVLESSLPSEAEDPDPGMSSRRVEIPVAADDVVVLGISLGAIPFVCSDLVSAHPEWRRMVDRVGTVATQAFQLWFTESLEDLGAVGERLLTSGGYVEPFDTWADMSHLIPAEDWKALAAATPQTIAYLCNVLPDAEGGTESPWRATEIVKENALRFLVEHGLHLWPGAYRRYPTEVRWDGLVAPPGKTGLARLEAQFFRANVDPSERYVLSLPGSSSFRLEPGDSGYENLRLAGDWTECGLNVGCVESAVMSGMLAAYDIQQTPQLDQIIGYKHA